MAYRNYSTAVGHIVDPNGLGDFTSIGAALAVATSGQTIFVRPNTYNENLNLVAGVDIVSSVADALEPNVIINGKCSYSGSGTVSLSGIRFQTNSDFCISVTGSNASILNIENCYINCSNNTGIQFSSTNSSSAINAYYCIGSTTDSATLFTQTSTGTLTFLYSQFTSGGTPTASTASAGTTIFSRSHIQCPITTSGTNNFSANGSTFNTSAINATAVTCGGTSGNNIFTNCNFSSGTATAIVISAGSIFECENGIVSSTNLNAVSGSGTLYLGSILFRQGSTSTINVSNITNLQNTLGILNLKSPLSQTSGGTGQNNYSGNLVLIQSLTASNSPSITFNTGISGYDHCFLRFTNYLPATNATNLKLVISTNGGVSYLNSGYQSSIADLVTGGGGVWGQSANTTSSILITGGSQNTSNPGFGELTFFNVGNGKTFSVLGQHSIPFSNSPYYGVTWGINTATNINAFQFTSSSGNITQGTFNLYGIVN